MWNKPTWPDDEVAVLRKNWSVLTPAEIGRMIGRTRKAVIGKGHRMGLPSKRIAHPRDPSAPAREPEPPMQEPHTFEGPDEGDGDRLLWIAVVARAAEDARGNVVTDNGASQDLRDKIQRDALRWFTQAGPDYREVCEMAGLDWRHMRALVVEGDDK